MTPIISSKNYCQVRSIARKLQVLPAAKGDFNLCRGEEQEECILTVGKQIQKRMRNPKAQHSGSSQLRNQDNLFSLHVKEWGCREKRY